LPVFGALAATNDTGPPKPCGPVPSERQLRWHDLEFCGMIHFGLGTFTDREWGFGDESPALFNPTKFDATQIAGLARQAGMKGLVLVCKHHDGFCLWPSRYTERSVKHSLWRNGQGDLVREVSEACRQQGLKFGVYLSPWDRNHKDYGRPEYLTYYRNQLSELLTNYGDIFISWHDGACGGDGYYGGARESRKVNGASYYDWPTTWALIRRLQPEAVIFSDAGPDVRWVGNERGTAGNPCWYTMDLASCYPGMPNYTGHTTGHRGGRDWAPPECNVSIRDWWFYHARDDARVKSTADLVNLYFLSVGRGACLNLNLAPDKRGRIPELDAASLQGMRQWLDATFAVDLAQGAKVTTSQVRGVDRRFVAENVLDQRRDTYWTTDDGIKSGELVLDWGKPVRFNVVRLREYLPLGQRVESFALDQWQDGHWTEFFVGRSIGNQRLVRVKPLSTEKVRLRIVRSSACPVISEVGIFQEPEA
jgi:alpha-L-fucosidase